MDDAISIEDDMDEDDGNNMDDSDIDSLMAESKQRAAIMGDSRHDREPQELKKLPV